MIINLDFLQSYVLFCQEHNHLLNWPISDHMVILRGKNWQNHYKAVDFDTILCQNWILRMKITYRQNLNKIYIGKTDLKILKVHKFHVIAQSSLKMNISLIWKNKMVKPYIFLISSSFATNLAYFCQYFFILNFLTNFGGS